MRRNQHLENTTHTQQSEGCVKINISIILLMLNNWKDAQIINTPKILQTHSNQDNTQRSTPQKYYLQEAKRMIRQNQYLYKILPTHKDHVDDQK